MKKYSTFLFCLLTFVLKASSQISFAEDLSHQPVPDSRKASLQQVLTHYPSHVAKAGEWLRGQQNDVTGLLRSYNMPGDWKAWTYDQAMGTIALLAVGDVDTAKQCIDGMLAVRRDTNDTNCLTHVWVDGYNSSNGNEEANSIAVGPNAWMGLALLRLYQVTMDSNYLSAAKDVANFLLERQAQHGCAAGSIAGGYDEFCIPFTWTSTEHNADAVAFLISLAEVTDVNAENYRDAAVRVADWLEREMWDPSLGCYYTGYADYNLCTISDFPERLDSQTWTLLALQVLAAYDDNEPNMYNGLPWIDQNTCHVNYNDCNLSGFAKVTLGLRATESFWVEGTAGYILAAGASCHSKENQNQMTGSLDCLQDTNGAVPYSVGVTCPDINQYFDPCDIILATFEGHPHCLFGQVGVYGDGAPDWVAIENAGYSQPYTWYYEPEKPGYDPNNVHNCWQSFRLVNATEMCLTQDLNWASLGLDMGPEVNGVITYRDVSDYEKFVFWAKTEDNNDNNIQVIFRDANSPQVSYYPTPRYLSTDWTEHHVNLAEISGADLSKLEHVGFGFGNNTGNSPGTIIYLDDIGFTGSNTMTPLSNGADMPTAFPQHWPYDSIAATAWLILVELQINPFAANSESPLKPCLTPLSDLNIDCWINFYDLAILCNQWLQAPGSPSADIAPPTGDGMVDLLDLAVVANQWLEYGS
ncbi:MAG: hypothetical protein PHQ35_03195 [Phycisphaerae bacterium]|nr:hypothetical protein [Phycisphaerae bacterium]MDD5380701.1 hypothetical protein [Phycisphaerae bacterium]